jgi:4-amino-4-deoxy-L-arabinose transferase-like glycosyltransferase
MNARLQLLGLLFIAAVWLYRTPYSAGNLEVPPDTVEYALAPLQLLETGRYQIVLENRPLPPRYPPWFQAAVILPAYVVFGHDPGNAILPITALAVGGVGFAWAIGRRVSGYSGGVLAALAVMFLPTYSAWSTQVMTDVPCTALILGGCVLYLRVRAGAPSLGSFFGAGLLVAFTALCRPVCAAMLFPFAALVISQRPNRFPRIAVLLLPMAAAAGGALMYNKATFGSPFRNGYNFWTAIPYDYPNLVFSTANIAGNLGVVAGSSLPLLLGAIAVAWLLARKREPAAFAEAERPLRDVITFFALTTVPILLFHLLYFFRGERFHLPIIAGAAAIAGSLLGLLAAPFRRTFTLLLPATALVVIASRFAVPETVPHRRLAAERIRNSTPPNAIVISAIDPVYLGYMAARDSARRIVPISRRVEYASKVLVPKNIEQPNPPPADWRDGGTSALLDAGARRAVSFVASEQIDSLAAEAAQGTPIYLDVTFTDSADAPVLTQLRHRFTPVQRALHLFELRPL